MAVDETDEQVLDTARREAQESVDKALACLARGGNLEEMFDSTGHPIDVVRLIPEELRLIGEFDVSLPPPLRWAARHFVYRRKTDGQPYVLSEAKNTALHSLGWVHITALMIDTNRRN